MTAIRLTAFRGAVKKLHPRLLPEANGVNVQNVRTLRGDLRPWLLPLAVATAPANSLTIYRMGRDAPSDSQYWLSWPERVDAILGLNPTDTTERTIFTGHGVPQWTDNTLALATPPYPTASRILGVPPPTGAPTATIHTDGTAGTAVNVNVVVTFVNDRGEEGSISSPSPTVVAHPGATLDVTNFPTAPAGAYGINRIRIYATNIGNTSASYAFAGEVAYGTTTAAIDLSALGSALETTDYDMPPADGHSIVPLWEFAAMASGKSVRFCAVGLIYAWPEAFRMLIGDTVVGLGVFDQAVLVLTTARPRLIQGSDPSAMSLQDVPLDQACVSAASIVSFAHGVAWASPDGLMYYGSTGPANLTAAVMTQSDWRALNPATIVGSQQEGQYYGSYLDAGNVRRGFIIDPQQPDGLIFLTDLPAVMYRDSIQDALFTFAGTSIQKWNAGTTAMTATFVSKVYRMPTPAAFDCARVVADAYGQMIRFYADGVLIYSKTVTDGDVFRLPLGGDASDWQFSIDTQVPLQALLVGDDIEEISG